MSIMTLKLTMDRIEFATKKSPIVVCLIKSNEKLNVFFGSTVMSKKIIEGEDPNILGVFDRSMSMVWIEKKIRDALKAHQ